MQSGNKIRLKTWADNYERFIDAALDTLSNKRPSDGAALLRLTAQQWADHYSSRAMCVSTLKGFMVFAVRDNRFRAPQSWLIDEYDAKPIRGEKPQKYDASLLEKVSQARRQADLERYEAQLETFRLEQVERARIVGDRAEELLAMVERSLRHHLDAGTCLQARGLPAVMAVACKALEGAMNIEATALGIAEFLESVR